MTIDGNRLRTEAIRQVGSGYLVRMAAKETLGLVRRVSGGVVVCFQDDGHDDGLLYSTGATYRIGNSGSLIAMLQYLLGVFSWVPVLLRWMQLCSYAIALAYGMQDAMHVGSWSR